MISFSTFLSKCLDDVKVPQLVNMEMSINLKKKKTKKIGMETKMLIVPELDAIRASSNDSSSPFFYL